MRTWKNDHATRLTMERNQNYPRQETWSTFYKEEEECEDVDAEPAPKRACYSLIKSTKEINTTQQEKARNTQRKYNNKMKTSKPNTISFQVNNFVKIKSNKVE